MRCRQAGVCKACRQQHHPSLPTSLPAFPALPAQTLPSKTHVHSVQHKGKSAKEAMLMSMLRKYGGRGCVGELGVGGGEGGGEGGVKGGNVCVMGVGEGQKDAHGGKVSRHLFYTESTCPSCPCPVCQVKVLCASSSFPTKLSLSHGGVYALASISGSVEGGRGNMSHKAGHKG